MVRSVVTAAWATERTLAYLARPVIWCEASDRIADVARRIGAAGLSCALVRTSQGVGVVTDHDFRHAIATGDASVDAPVSTLATVPVLTIHEHATQAEALLRMVQHAVHHLAVTDQHGSPIGVLRAVDLAQAEVRDPLLVRSAVESATSIDDVAEAARMLPDTIVSLCDSGHSATYVGAIHAAVIDAVIRQVLRIRGDSTLPATGVSWVALGSLARRESLPLSDVDSAMVWADPSPGAVDAAESIRTSARGVLDDLRRCGLAPCPNGVNADNPQFSRCRRDWTAAITSWHEDSSDERALLMTATLADNRPLTDEPLGRCLTDALATIGGHTRVLRALLDEALRFKPPTGFVRDFVVEHGGQHSGELDLKKGGLAPVTGLARWVGLATGNVRGGTAERLRRGASLGVLTDDEAKTLAGAFEYVYEMLLSREADALRRASTPTTYLVPGELDTLTRRHLREAFRAIRSVQDHIDEHWLARLERAQLRA
jgi:CBS domain-containing protein